MNTESKPMYGWNDLPWKQFERQVFKLQKRIYRASQRGDMKTVHKLQRLLMNSWSAKCLAVRRVTQDNQGKKTAGIDGMKSLSPTHRLALVSILKLLPQARPVRRVWIPKPGTQEKRGLGIPVMYDRALQALVKLALEPEWEARFEPNSYGFRPGRCTHDAIEAIRFSIRLQDKYVLDADLAKCFDRINHQELLTKLATFPALRRVIKSWLKAGVMEGLVLTPTEEGCPQGGVVSPLLANVALHGLEEHITSSFPARIKREGQNLRWQPTVVRYADDLVILHRDKTVIEQAKQRAADWLAKMGLEFKPSKTWITHTLYRHDGKIGFTFLGFEIRQFPAGKRHSGKTGGKHQVQIGFKTIIRPSKEAMHRHQERIKEVVERNKAKSQSDLIWQLNPIIWGWSNYYCRENASEAFGKADHLTFLKLWRWAKRRHRNKSHHWIASKYWHIEKGGWNFESEDGRKLYKHKAKHIEPHIKVEGARSPFDGDWSYWATRMGRHPELPMKHAQLLKRQHGRCAWCELYFTSEDVLEVDHIVPKALGGGNALDNLQLLHRHCHDQKTEGDGSSSAKKKRSTCDKGQTVEEPDDSETVTSGSEAERRG
ncbi:MAG: group II intron reverse transcriptase/maturase [Ktedonobacter sp. 13_2_20CM_53_11]|nr:MAG: group II intron reverse transcriptase/maturase [Ktedonobacter sp. 13_2_20CM_53_11]